MSNVLRYLWALPASLVGLTFAALWVLLGASGQWRDGVLEVSGGGMARGLARLPRSWRFGAITFGHVVLASDEAMLAGCREHERVHVRQYERWGVLFFPLYLGSSLVQCLRGRRPYWDNYFEREAYRLCPAPGMTTTADAATPTQPGDRPSDTRR